MFKDVTELKDFIIWCKTNKIKSFEQKDVKFELSELAFVDELTRDPVALEELKQESIEDRKFEEAQQQKEDDELLFWSTDQ